MVKKKTLKKIVEKYYMDYYAVIIVACTSLSIFVLSRILDRFGFDDPSFRYPLATLFSAIPFMIFLGIWEYRSLGELKPKMAKDELITQAILNEIPSDGLVKKRRGSLRDLDILELFDGDLDLILVGILAVVLVVVSFLMLFEFPMLLGELALQSLIGGGIYKSVRDIQITGYTFRTYWKIAKSYLILVCWSFIIGYLIHSICPMAVRFIDLFSSPCG